MKNISLLILLFVIVCSFNSCKKGEEDPFISLRSRTNRLTGKWNLESSIGRIKVIYADNRDVEYQYYRDTEINNSFRYKKVSNYAYGFYINFDSYTFNVDIDKSGTTSSYVIAINESKNYSKTTEGTWKWSKDKKQLYFTHLNIIYDDLIKQISEEYGTYLEFEISESIIEQLRTFNVVRLTNKELTLSLDYSANLNNQEIKSINTIIEFKFTKI